MEEKKYKIKELVKYYVERYSLETNFQSDSNEGANDGLGTYITAMTRIMQNVSIGRSNLWNALKAKNQARQITIPEFEQLCFQQWAEYIENNCESYNRKELESDKERVYKLYTYFEERREEYFKFLDSLEDNDPNTPTLSFEQFRTLKNEMMLTAIFELFFTPIDANSLYDDLYHDMFLKNELSLDQIDLDIEEKLKNPEGNYYHRKKNTD